MRRSGHDLTGGVFVTVAGGAALMWINQLFGGSG
jgi:hypothetical protein